MDHFAYRDGALWCEDVPLAEAAERFGTPAFVYSRRTLEDHFDRLSGAFAPLEPRICFSVKSCSNLHVLRVMRQRGAWFDVVSGGELRRVMEAGGDPGQVVFAGVGKTAAEIEAALQAGGRGSDNASSAAACDRGVAWFNVESEQEMEALSEIARRLGTTARAALRINPDVDPRTHLYTTTGKRETKFGVDIERARAAFKTFGGRAGLDLCGLHLHIGSPVNDTEPYVQAVQKAVALVDALRRDGHQVRAINIGGGFGAHYQGSEAPPAAQYAARIVPLLRVADVEVLLEPGRSISANAGVLLTRLQYVKQSGDRQFYVVDAAMTDLLRPALYGAYHFVWPVRPTAGLVPPHRGADLRLEGTHCADVVGGVCESGDFLAKERWLPPAKRGDLLAIFSAGAYGFSMSSQYNSRPRACEVLIEGKAARLIRRRETYDDLVVAERI